jgi:hypothetical protein
MSSPSSALSKLQSRPSFRSCSAERTGGVEETSVSSSVAEDLLVLLDMDFADLADRAISSLFFLVLRAFSRTFTYKPGLGLIGQSGAAAKVAGEDPEGPPWQNMLVMCLKSNPDNSN